MPTHTQYLDNLIILSAVLFPSGLGANISVLMRKRYSTSVFESLLGMIIGYMVLLAAIFFASPEKVGKFNMPSLWFYPVAIVAGFVIITLEICTGALLFFIQNGKLPEGIRVHESYSGARNITIIDIIAVVIFVLLEEIVLRQVAYNTLVSIGLPDKDFVLMIVLLSSIYAVNHVTFSINAVFQKFFSGVVFVLLYLLSGNSLIVPVTAHMVQNLFLLLRTERRASK